MSPIRLFSTVYLHQAVLVAGIVFCLLLALRAMNQVGASQPAMLLFPLLSLGGAFLFARLAYCAFRPDSPYSSVEGFFRADLGGMMFYGGMLGAALALWIAARLSHLHLGRLADAAAPACALLIAFIRLSEGLRGGNYGDWLEEDSPFAWFPFAVYDPYYESWIGAVFMAGVLIALLIALLLWKTNSHFPGDRALLLMGLYASWQVVLESMRFDDFLRWGFVRCSQVLSAFVIAAVLFAYGRRGAGRRRCAAVYALFVSCVALCIVLEFAVDGKIGFLLFLTPGYCHALMAGLSAVMSGCVLSLRRAAVS